MHKNQKLKGLFMLCFFFFRRHKPRYEFLALTPKYMAAGRGGPGSPAINGGHQGWISDHESDIPISLLPKHVSGLHACENMAFHKDFESIHAARLLRHSNDGGSLIGNVHAANTYPDILNGRPGNDIIILIYCTLSKDSSIHSDLEDY